MKNFAIITGKQLWWCQTFKSETLLKRDFNTGTFLLVSIYKNTYPWMLLNFRKCFLRTYLVQTFYILIIQTNCIQVIALQKKLLTEQKWLLAMWNLVQFSQDWKKNVSYYKISGQERNDTKGTWISLTSLT